MTRNFTDEELVAFLNGELNDARAEELALALEDDAALADRLERLDPLSAEIKSAFDEVLAIPVPDRLRDAISMGQEKKDTVKVISFAAAKAEKESRRFRWPEYAAMAASLAIGLVIGGQRGVFGPAVADADAVIVASANGPTLAPVVAQFLASKAGGETQQLAGLGLARASISFSDGDDRFCRQFSIEANATATDGVACLNDGRWDVAAIGTRSIEGGDIRTASGDASPAVLAAVDDMIDGDPLDAEAEKAALDRLGR
jgi:hypothetical protein